MKSELTASWRAASATVIHVIAPGVPGLPSRCISPRLAAFANAQGGQVVGTVQPSNDASVVLAVQAGQSHPSVRSLNGQTVRRGRPRGLVPWPVWSPTRTGNHVVLLYGRNPLPLFRGFRSDQRLERSRGASPLAPDDDDRRDR